MRSCAPRRPGRNSRSASPRTLDSRFRRCRRERQERNSDRLVSPLASRIKAKSKPLQHGRSNMPLYMYQAAYTGESWAAQLKNPQNRVEAVGRAACEAVGGKLIGGWYCFGEYDLVIIADVPDNESMSAIAMAIAAGGALKAGKTTVLMSGAGAVAALKKAETVAKVY